MGMGDDVSSIVGNTLIVPMFHVAVVTTLRVYDVYSVKVKNIEKRKNTVPLTTEHTSHRRSRPQICTTGLTS